MKAAIAAVLFSMPVLAWAEAGYSLCGSLDNAYGPFDYRTDRDKLPIVEGAHFTPAVEMLLHASTGYIGGDIDYTLRAFPNHHRALVAMMRFGERTKSTQPPQARYTVECYFERALRFRPDDTTARMLYATFLIKNGRVADASSQMERVVYLAGDDGFTHFNAGLVYMDMKSYDKALQQAHRALALGFTRLELQNKLKAAGKWVEPPATSASQPEPVATDAASAPASSPAANESAAAPAR